MSILNSIKLSIIRREHRETMSLIDKALDKGIKPSRIVKYSLKKAMIDIQKYLDKSGLKSKLIIQVHDELVFDVPKDELEKSSRKLQR